MWCFGGENRDTREVAGNLTTGLWQPDNHQPPVLSGFLSLFRLRKPVSMVSFLINRILRSIPNGVLTAHTEWLPDAWLSPTCAVHVEDCGGWWLFVCRSSVAEHWQHKPGVPEPPAILPYLFFASKTSKFSLPQCQHWSQSMQNEFDFSWALSQQYVMWT